MPSTTLLVFGIYAQPSDSAISIQSLILHLPLHFLLGTLEPALETLLNLPVEIKSLIFCQFNENHYLCSR